MENVSIKAPILRYESSNKEKLNAQGALDQLPLQTEDPPKVVNTPTKLRSSKQKMDQHDSAKNPQVNSLQVSLIGMVNDVLERPKRADSISILDQSLRSVPTANILGGGKLDTPKPSSKQISDPNEPILTESNGGNPNKPAQEGVTQPPSSFLITYEHLRQTVFYQQKLSKWTAHSIEHDDKYFKNHQINHVDASMVLSSYSRDT